MARNLWRYLAGHLMRDGADLQLAEHLAQAECSWAPLIAGLTRKAYAMATRPRCAATASQGSSGANASATTLLVTSPTTTPTSTTK
jgi:hypothetical protein